jgi:voltage-gated potassium channel Kch
MNGRGAVEIVVAGVGLEAGILPTDLFSILVFMAIATTATAPVFLKAGVAWLERHGQLAPKTERRQGVVLVGAGPLARILARQLRHERRVTLIDPDAANVQEADLEGLRAIVGDPLESAVLREARIDNAGAMVALTPNALVNVLAAQRAKERFRVDDVRAALTDGDQGGLFHVLETFGGRPAFAFPVDIADLDARLAARVMAGLPERLVTLRGSDVGRLEPAGVLPLVVRGPSGTSLFESWQDLRPEDEVVAIDLAGE